MDNSGSAFPVIGKWEEKGKEFTVVNTGLTKREWFAGMALQGIFSNRDYLISTNELAKQKGKTLAELISLVCYENADAMLAASQEEETP